MRVNHGCPHVTVPEQLLNRSDIKILLEEMAGETVAKSMSGDALADARVFCCPLDSLLHMGRIQMVALQFSRSVLPGQLLGREQPLPDATGLAQLAIKILGVNLIRQADASRQGDFRLWNGE